METEKYELIQALMDYVGHKSDCQMKQDTTEWAMAIGDMEDTPEKSEEFEKLRKFQNTCTCGMEDLTHILD